MALPKTLDFTTAGTLTSQGWTAIVSSRSGEAYGGRLRGYAGEWFVNVWPTDVPGAAQSVKCTSYMTNSDAYLGLVARFSNTEETGVELFWTGSGSMTLQTVSAGTPTTIFDTGYSPPSNGQTVELIVDGSNNITVKVNDSTVYGPTSHTVPSQYHCGVCGYGAAGTIEIDDVIISELATGSSAALSGSAVTPSAGTQAPGFSIGL